MSCYYSALSSSDFGYTIMLCLINFLFSIRVVIAVGLFGCDGRILRWIPNTNFENPQNWRSGRLPCQNEHVRFPPRIVSVFLQRNNSMLELVGYSYCLCYIIS